MDILIIDDSSAARFFLKSCIPPDITVHEAEDGAEGLENFKKLSPGLTFLDLTMPVMNGFEVLEKIKELNPSSLVVVLSSDIQKKTQERILKLGALTFLPKPPEKAVIIEVIEKAKKLYGEING